MKFGTSLVLLSTLAISLSPVQAQKAPPLDAASRQLAHDVFKQLIEINTTDSVGSTTVAAEAMKKRFLDAGFPASDLHLLIPSQDALGKRKGDLVVRYRGKADSKLKPMLIICHLDVVEAPRNTWKTDPFQFVEKDGYYYGRGTQDMKDSDAIIVTDLIRLKKEGFVPDRDIILALTAAEEGGAWNGVDWLMKNHRDLVDADFALNPDSGGVTTENGKPMEMGVEATEKLYADFALIATNPGGHSSVPTKENAIYQASDALGRLEKAPFPFELNEVTRSYFKQMATIEKGQRAEDMLAILKTPPDPAAIARLSEDPHYNSTMRTTCVATMFKAGQARNALPQRAEANVNCRILPGYSQEEIRQKLVGIFNDPTIKVQYVDDSGNYHDQGTDRKSLPPPPVREDVFQPLRKVVNEIWPGMPVVPVMETGASDSIYTMAAGIPSYGISGVAIDENDDRAHAVDERLKVESYYTGVQFYYMYLKALTGGK
ncbi:MAG: M20/M25/M40 family metallo-hydrolase [Acidobacteriaceae bacterium]